MVKYIINESGIKLTPRDIYRYALESMGELRSTHKMEVLYGDRPDQSFTVSLSGDEQFVEVEWKGRTESVTIPEGEFDNDRAIAKCVVQGFKSLKERMGYLEQGAMLIHEDENNKKKSNGMKITLNEQQFINLINKSVKRTLNEWFYFNNDGHQPIDNDPNEVPDEDDWKSKEPSDDDVRMAFGDIQQHCREWNLNFKDCGDHEFAVTCKIGPDGKAEGNIGEFLALYEQFKKQGMLNQLGGGISPNGLWYRKYRILKCW